MSVILFRVATRPNALAVFTSFFAVLTVVTAPFAYFLPLFVTAPVLAALVANLYVGSGSSLGVRSGAAILGPALLVSVVWFSSRVDEVPVEGVAAASIAIGSIVLLRHMRARNSRPPHWLTDEEVGLWESRFGRRGRE